MTETEGLNTDKKEGKNGLGGVAKILVPAMILGIPLAAANKNKEMHDERMQEASLADSLLRLQQAEELKKRKKESEEKSKNPSGTEPLHIPSDGTPSRQALMEIAGFTTPSSLKKRKDDDNVEIEVGEPTKEELAKPNFTPLPMQKSRSTNRSRSTSPTPRAASPASSGK